MIKKLLIPICFIFITCFSSSLSAQTIEDVVDGLNNPFGLVFYENELYISSQNVPGAGSLAGNIVKIDPFAATPVPEVVAEVSLSTSVVVYNGFLYVTDVSSIQKIDLSAATPTPEVVLSGLGFPNGLLVIEDELYFCQTTNGSVDKIDLTQTMPTISSVITQGLLGPIALAHDDGVLYIAESDASEVSKVDLSDADLTLSVVIDEVIGLVDIIIDGDYAYLALDDDIARFNITDSNPTEELFINNVDAPHGLEFIDGELFIAELAMGKVVKVSGITPQWSSLDPVCSSAGPQTLGGASPGGGTYSGAGVTDNGDGATFSFDPAAAGGAGTYMITYTLAGESVQSSIEVTAGPMVSFTAPGPFEPGAGLQMLTSGMPTGGVYTGTGVVDNGDGTYAFDPSTGIGTYMITYTVTDGDGCSGSASDEIVVESCELPVINGINVINCSGGNTFTLEVDGALNGAEQWEWTAPSFNGQACEDQPFLFTGNQLPNATFLQLDWVFYIRATGGCIDAPVCFAYVPSELIADALGVSFTAPGPFTTADGVQSLTGGMPAGGTYSGTGVIDNGDGTYSFDPGIGAGTYTITYSYTDGEGTGCTGSSSDDIVVESCVEPVINGVNIIMCDGNNITFEVDGDLGDAEEWQWYASLEPCFLFEGLIGTGSTITYDYLNPDNAGLSFSVRTSLDCIDDEPICLEFDPVAEIAEAVGVSFTAPGPFMTTDGIQPLMGGMPAGGSYVGTGVIDNGDGSYSFDPSVGVGLYPITYFYTDTGGNNCIASATDEIVVEQGLISGDICMDAIDINSQFGQTPNEIQSSGPYDNDDATTDDSDPTFGWECFGEPDGGGGAPSLERTLWFSFEGDGEEYFIEALACGDDPIDFSDTQMAIYSGDCDNLVSVFCVDDGPNADGGAAYYPAGGNFQTEAGVTYYMMIDGFGPDFAADGEFCIETTLLEEVIELTTVTFQVDASLLVDNAELAADGIHLAGGFNSFNGEPMNEGADNIWSLTLDIEPGTYSYKFQNGQGNFEGIDISIGENCTVGGYNDRQVIVEDMAITTDLVCYSYCVACDMVNSTDSETLAANIDVFPNPAKDVLNVNIDLPEVAGNLNIRLVNVFGQVVSDQYLGQLQSDNIELDLSKVPAGAYMLQVRDGQAQFTQAVVVQK